MPTTYYSTTSGVGRTLNHFREAGLPGGLAIGAVGLGTGTLAAYVAEGDLIRFYEINPAVVEIAESARWFTYLKDCRARGGQCEIKLGDARLSLQQELAEGQRGRYHVLVLDAFSGDGVPTHLLTERALAMYIQHLSGPADGGPHGALAVHLSNRYLDLEPVVRGAAQHFGIPAVYVRSLPDPRFSISGADWIILTRNEPLLADLAPFAALPATPIKPAILWTDTDSNLFDVLQ
jgi:hypothetical protein